MIEFNAIRNVTDPYPSYSTLKGKIEASMYNNKFETIFIYTSLNQIKMNKI